MAFVSRPSSRDRRPWREPRPRFGPRTASSWMAWLLWASVGIFTLIAAFGYILGGQ